MRSREQRQLCSRESCTGVTLIFVHWNVNFSVDCHVRMLGWGGHFYLDKGLKCKDCNYQKFWYKCCFVILNIIFIWSEHSRSPVIWCDWYWPIKFVNELKRDSWKQYICILSFHVVSQCFEKSRPFRWM